MMGMQNQKPGQRYCCLKRKECGGWKGSTQEKKTFLFMSNQMLSQKLENARARPQKKLNLHGFIPGVFVPHFWVLEIKTWVI